MPELIGGEHPCWRVSSRVHRTRALSLPHLEIKHASFNKAILKHSVPKPFRLVSSVDEERIDNSLPVHLTKTRHSRCRFVKNIAPTRPSLSHPHPHPHSQPTACQTLPAPSPTLHYLTLLTPSHPIHHPPPLLFIISSPSHRSRYPPIIRIPPIE